MDLIEILIHHILCSLPSIAYINGSLFLPYYKFLPFLLDSITTNWYSIHFQIVFLLLNSSQLCYLLLATHFQLHGYRSRYKRFAFRI